MGNVLEIAAFTYNNIGGNPAGVLIDDEHPPENEMLSIAKEVGYSETAFLKPYMDGFRIRYFSPEIEIPFCGHATIASGTAIGELHGTGVYKLYLNSDDISIDITKSENIFSTTLRSPETYTSEVPTEYIDIMLTEFNLNTDDINLNFPIKFASAGAKHIIIFLNSREKLSKMEYQLEPVKNLMFKEEISTISLLWEESENIIHSRNAFAAGGVYEDPATGAAAAALGGYLRDIKWKGNKSFEVLQGEDMGFPSQLFVQYTLKKGEGVKVSGKTRFIKK